MNPFQFCLLSSPCRLRLIAALVMGSMLVLHAETAAKKTATPGDSVTNHASAIHHDTSPAATNSSSAVAPVSAPAAPTTSSPMTISQAGHSLTITTKGDADDDDDDSSWSKNGVRLGMVALLIPIAGIVASFATPVLIIFLYFYFRNRRRRENLALAREFLNKGMPVPPQLLDESLKPANYGVLSVSANPGRSADFRKGIKTIFVGLALCVVFLLVFPHSTTWAWGLIPVIVGLGFVLSGFLAPKIDGPETGSTPPPPSAGPN